MTHLLLLLLLLLLTQCDVWRPNLQFIGEIHDTPETPETLDTL
jgi:hypothetical protein